MLQPQRRTEIPEMTQLVAKTAFPKGSIFMTLRDELGPIFEDERFAHLYPGTGQPSESPARLAMVTILQFLENLTDRQAADALRGRIDWKYGLGLELTNPGFHYSVLSEFRQRLVTGESEGMLQDIQQEQCKVKGLLGGGKKQRTDSTHILAAVRSLTWTELVGETMRQALDSIAQVARIRCTPSYSHYSGLPSTSISVAGRRSRKRIISPSLLGEYDLTLSPQLWNGHENSGNDAD